MTLNLDEIRKRRNEWDSVFQNMHKTIGQTKTSIEVAIGLGILFGIILDAIILGIVYAYNLWSHVEVVAPLFITAALAVSGILVGGLMPSISTGMKGFREFMDAMDKQITKSRERLKNNHERLNEMENRTEIPNEHGEEVKEDSGPLGEQEHIKLLITVDKGIAKEFPKLQKIYIDGCASFAKTLNRFLFIAILVIAVLAGCLLLCSGYFSYLATAIAILCLGIVPGGALAFFRSIVRISAYSATTGHLYKLLLLNLDFEGIDSLLHEQ